MKDKGRYYVQRLVTTLGAHTYTQEHLAAQLHAKIKDLPDAQSITQMVRFIYERSGVKKRHLEFPLREIEARKDWICLVNEAVLSMSTRTLDQLFSQGISAADCDCLIVGTSSYIGFPGLTRVLQERFGFPLDTLCYDVNGMGCATVPHSLYIAQMILDTGRCNNVCILCVDAFATCGESRQHFSAPEMSQVVAHCLPSDSAGAVIISRQPQPHSIFSYEDATLSTKLWPDSLNLNVMSADAYNQPLLSVGKEIRTRILEEMGYFFNETVLQQPIFIHHGGDALMRLVGEKYPQLSEFIKLSTQEFQEHGNIGPSTVMWILNKALEVGMPLTPCFRLVTLGPGKVTAVLQVDGVKIEQWLPNQVDVYAFS
jgi:predicted naringenin-chalcone synthase